LGLPNLCTLSERVFDSQEICPQITQMNFSLCLDICVYLRDLRADNGCADRSSIENLFETSPRLSDRLKVLIPLSFWTNMQFDRVDGSA
jgi:hypothetical protein